MPATHIRSCEALGTKRNEDKQCLAMLSAQHSLPPHLLVVRSASATMRPFAVGAGRPAQSRTLSSMKAPRDTGAVAVTGGTGAAGAVAGGGAAVTAEMMRLMTASPPVFAVRPHKYSRKESATVACTARAPSMAQCTNERAIEVSRTKDTQLNAARTWRPVRQARQANLMQQSQAACADIKSASEPSMTLWYEVGKLYRIDAELGRDPLQLLWGQELPHDSRCERSACIAVDHAC